MLQFSLQTDSTLASQPKHGCRLLRSSRYRYVMSGIHETRDQIKQTKHELGQMHIFAKTLIRQFPGRGVRSHENQLAKNAYNT